jgi:type VI secretion system protein ImpL
MSDVKPARRPVGYVLGVATLCLLLLLLAVLMNDGWSLSRRGSMGWIVAAIAVLGMILFFLYGPVYGTWIWFSRRVFREYRRGTAFEAQLLKRDPRLQRMYEELRLSHGWFWRHRLHWLLVNGADQRIDQIAPGLKQAGIMHVDETVLVHVSPDGIEAAKWLDQIRRLRRRRPVDGVVHVTCANDTDTELPRTLSGIATALGWAAPVTFLHPVDAENDQPARFDAVGAFMPDVSRRQAQAAAARLVDLFHEIEQQTAIRGVRECGEPGWINSMLKISEYIGDHAEWMIGHLRALAASQWLRAPLAGIMFAPVFPGATVVPVPVPVSVPIAAGDNAQRETATTIPMAMLTREQPRAMLPVWREIAVRMPRYRGRRAGLYWPDVLAWFVLAGAITWIVLLVISAVGNRALVLEAEATAATALTARPGTPPALRAQLALQNEIATLESRRQHGVPWYLRAGLSRNDDLLAALWRPYQNVATRNLQQPVAHALEGQLGAFSKVRADEQQSHDAQQRAYNQLKAYLMLATPARVDAPFLKTQLLDVWPAPADMRAGEWLDTSQQLAGFWATHLKAHPAWRISPAAPLVTQMRSTLVNQIGLAASDDVLYRSAIDAARGKYADISLATLLAGADSHGLFTTTQTVPGIYTRAAWEGVIEKAIDDAANDQHVEADWVLTDDGLATQVNATTVRGAIGSARATVDAKRDADDLRQRLRTRYFTDYAAAWATMLNSFQWIGATNFSGVIDQLTRLTDAQTSPLLAVMKSVQYQGQAGRPSQALTDTLVRKAQGLLGSSGGDTAQAPVANPLDRSFGPLLALMGDANPPSAGGNAGNAGNAPAANVAAFNGVSLSRVLTADTTVRLKLQQIQASPDAQAMARSLAQSVFQGKLSDLSQARDDAALTAASLGAQWAGFGQTLFVQPLDAAWQAVLQPAAASLNEAWRASVAAPFAASFSSRYPFSPTAADASFAEFGHYVRPDTGLVNRFIQVELSGVLKRQGDQWVPNELAPQSLQFDPKFLAMLRLIGPLGARLYAQGEAGYRFEIMPQSTSNVTRTELTIDGQQIVYFNQRETWTPLAWPGNGLNGRASLNWQTLEAGVRVAFDTTGDWAFLRMLEKAQIRPLDDTRYELVWNAGADNEAAKAASATPGDGADNKAAPLRYVLRAQSGAGPLDLLKLRGFRMPERIFVTGRAGAISGQPSLPPLPPELQP